MRNPVLAAVALAAAAASTAPALARAQAPAAKGAKAPRTASKPATTGAITVADLRLRSFVYADDSMGGRGTATIGHVKATNYIAAELTRVGATPAGDNGTFFQAVPVVNRAPDAATAPSVNGTRFTSGKDYIARDQGPSMRSIDGVQVVFGGTAGDTASMISPDAAAGKFVLLAVAPSAAPTPNRQILTRRYIRSAGIGVISLERLPDDLKAALSQSGPTLAGSAPNSPPLPVYAYLSTAMANTMLGAPVATAASGAAGGTISGTMRFAEQPTEHPVRNVVAIIPGSDPALKSQYIVLGAHSDHIGFEVGSNYDSDSVHIGNQLFRKGGADEAPVTLTPAQWDTLKAKLAAVRGTSPARRDSIYNGADDDGSGSMGLLEIAEYFATNPKARPSRSLLFVWHTSEELGLWGSEWYTDHPTVPRDSIIAAINIDMIGRGSKTDIENGGDEYIQLLGSRRLSTVYGDFVESLAKSAPHTMRLDYTFDAPGHPQQYYCRSDHWNYARYGIPTVFFSTGGHGDYHMVSDEPAYLDYPHFRRVVQFVADLAQKAGNRAGGFPLDKPVPGPNAQCVQ
jgi:hypothetical protein